mmetsp:Transcript_112886/g.313878  ORF Transcript_112886/g.313878 Transcript_112886/m.313878 type:complete len:137 (+) Transcript_112886:154-564(+)
MPQGKHLKSRKILNAARKGTAPYSASRKQAAKTKKHIAFKGPKKAGKADNILAEKKARARMTAVFEEQAAGKLLRVGDSLRMKDSKQAGDRGMAYVADGLKTQTEKSKAARGELRDVRRAEKLLKKATEEEAKRIA